MLKEAAITQPRDRILQGRNRICHGPVHTGRVSFALQPVHARRAAAGAAA
jgi:hypothetical protein